MQQGSQLQGPQALERGRDNIKNKVWEGAGQLERDMPTGKVHV